MLRAGRRARTTIREDRTPSPYFRYAAPSRELSDPADLFEDTERLDASETRIVRLLFYGSFSFADPERLRTGNNRFLGSTDLDAPIAARTVGVV